MTTKSSEARNGTAKRSKPAAKKTAAAPAGAFARGDRSSGGEVLG